MLTSCKTGIVTLTLGRGFIMPTYEYECQECGNTFEKFQSMTAEPLKNCPECKGRVQRLIGTGAGLIFKGSGFYITDYRSKDYKEKSKIELSSSKKGAESKTSDSKKDSSKPKETKSPDAK
jgi:putative FmdB family regulatory protein